MKCFVFTYVDYTTGTDGALGSADGGSGECASGTLRLLCAALDTPHLERAALAAFAALTRDMHPSLLRPHALELVQWILTSLSSGSLVNMIDVSSVEAKGNALKVFTCLGRIVVNIPNGDARRSAMGTILSTLSQRLTSVLQSLAAEISSTSPAAGVEIGPSMDPGVGLSASSMRQCFVSTSCLRGLVRGLTDRGAGKRGGANGVAAFMAQLCALLDDVLSPLQSQHLAACGWALHGPPLAVMPSGNGCPRRGCSTALLINQVCSVHALVINCTDDAAALSKALRTVFVALQMQLGCFEALGRGRSGPQDTFVWPLEGLVEVACALVRQLSSCRGAQGPLKQLVDVCLLLSLHCAALLDLQPPLPAPVPRQRQISISSPSFDARRREVVLRLGVESCKVVRQARVVCPAVLTTSAPSSSSSSSLSSTHFPEGQYFIAHDTSRPSLELLVELTMGLLRSQGSAADLGPALDSVWSAVLGGDGPSSEVLGAMYGCIRPRMGDLTIVLIVCALFGGDAKGPPGWVVKLAATVLCALHAFGDSVPAMQGVCEAIAAAGGGEGGPRGICNLAVVREVGIHRFAEMIGRTLVTHSQTPPKNIRATLEKLGLLCKGVLTSDDPFFLWS